MMGIMENLISVTDNIMAPVDLCLIMTSRVTLIDRGLLVCKLATLSSPRCEEESVGVLINAQKNCCL